jgi:hypothetical protein
VSATVANLPLDRLENLAYQTGRSIEIDAAAGRAYLTIETVTYVAELEAAS